MSYYLTSLFTCVSHGVVFRNFTSFSSFCNSSTNPSIVSLAYLCCHNSNDKGSSRIQFWDSHSGLSIPCPLNELLLPYPVRSVSWHPTQHILAVAMVSAITNLKQLHHRLIAIQQSIDPFIHPFFQTVSEHPYHVFLLSPAFTPTHPFLHPVPHLLFSTYSVGRIFTVA